MPKASVKRLIEWKKEDLINLVLDIEKYPEFVPFCYAAKIYETSEKNNQKKVIADLTIGKGPFKDTYKSDVRYNKDEDIIFVTNIDGPLNHLENKWYFIQKKEDAFNPIRFFKNRKEILDDFTYTKETCAQS